MSARHAALLALAAVAAACGTPGPVEPAAVTEPRDALSMGIRSYHDQNFFAARQLFAKAHALYRSLDDGRGQVMALVNLADSALVVGEHGLALAHLAQAERIAARDGVTGFDERLRLLKAQAVLESGAPDAAAQQLDALLAGPLEPAVRQAAVLERARVALRRGEEAAPWLAQARAAAAGSDAARASVLKLEARTAVQQGDRTAARAWLVQALELQRKARYRPGIAAAHEELGALAQAGGDRPAAQDHYERALAIRLWLSDRIHAAEDLQQLAAIGEAGGDRAQARRLRELRDYLLGGATPDWRIVQMRYEGLALP